MTEYADILKDAGSGTARGPRMKDLWKLLRDGKSLGTSGAIVGHVSPVVPPKADAEYAADLRRGPVCLRVEDRGTDSQNRRTGGPVMLVPTSDEGYEESPSGLMRGVFPMDEAPAHIQEAFGVLIPLTGGSTPPTFRHIFRRVVLERGAARNMSYSIWSSWPHDDTGEQRSMSWFYRPYEAVTFSLTAGTWHPSSIGGSTLRELYTRTYGDTRDWVTNPALRAQAYKDFLDTLDG